MRSNLKFRKGSCMVNHVQTRLQPKATFAVRVKKDIQKYWIIYCMLLPLIIYYVLFRYVPMYGACIAFLDYKPLRGITGSKFVGLKHFISFFNNYYFARILKNTLLISLESLIFSFPAPILLALLFNEVRSRTLKKAAQTIRVVLSRVFSHS